MSQSESSKRRAKHKAMGLCTECINPATHGTLCASHHAARREYDRKRYRVMVDDKRKRGMCVYRGCQCESIPGESYCGYHQEMVADKQARFHAKNIAAGLCPCGRPVKEGLNRHEVPYKLCPSCVESRRNSDKRIRAAKKVAKLAAMEAQDA